MPIILVLGNFELKLGRKLLDFERLMLSKNVKFSQFAKMTVLDFIRAEVFQQQKEESFYIISFSFMFFLKLFPLIWE